MGWGGVVTYGHKAIPASPSFLVFLHPASTMGPSLASQRTLCIKGTKYRVMYVLRYVCIVVKNIKIYIEEKVFIICIESMFHRVCQVYVCG